MWVFFKNMFENIGFEQIVSREQYFIQIIFKMKKYFFFGFCIVLFIIVICDLFIFIFMWFINIEYHRQFLLIFTLKQISLGDMNIYVRAYFIRYDILLYTFE